MNSRGMAKGELAFIIALVVGFLLPPAIFGQWWLFGVFLLFFLCFGLVEWISVKKTGKTVSQHVWTLPLWKRIIICSGMAIAWGALLWHFLAHS